MHHQGFVVTIINPDTKESFREYDHSKVGSYSKVKVPVPDNTEYAFRLKNQASERMRIEVSIDGSTISGSGFIINGHTDEVLERFLDSDKRFKAVLKDSEGVMDPTSPQNGRLVVRCWRELNLPHVFIGYNQQLHDTPWRPAIWTGDNISYGLTSSCLRGCTDGAVYTSANITPDPTPAEAMATVEGKKSDQTFVHTTWTGDATLNPVAVFEFQLLKANVIPGYCSDCGTKVTADHRFCHACGHKVK